MFALAAFKSRCKGAQLGNGRLQSSILDVGHPSPPAGYLIRDAMPGRCQRPGPIDSADAACGHVMGWRRGLGFFKDTRWITDDAEREAKSGQTSDCWEEDDMLMMLNDTAI